MGLDSCMRCIKYTLFIFNLIFWIIGAGVVVLGIYIYLISEHQLNLNIMQELRYEHTYKVAISIIVIGFVILLLGFFGCCGSILENKCMLIVFFVLMTFVLLASSALGGLVVFSRGTVEGEIIKFKHKFKNATENYALKNDSTSKDLVDRIQRNFSCCGVDGRADYTGKLPDSCIGHENEGCVKKLDNTFKLIWLTVLVVMFSTALVTLIGMTLSIMLCCALRDDEYD